MQKILIGIGVLVTICFAAVFASGQSQPWSTFIFNGPSVSFPLVGTEQVGASIGNGSARRIPSNYFYLLQPCSNGDSAFAIPSTCNYATTSAAFTAARSWTLPAASSMPNGSEITVTDAVTGGALSALHTLTIIPNGADVINGTTIISTANGALRFRTNGTTTWSNDGGSASVSTANANTVYAGPVSGSAAAAVFRALVSGDLPGITDNTKTTSYSVGSGDMANTLSLAATSGTPVLTLPTASSTIFAPGQSLTINVPYVANAVSWSLTNSTGLVLHGLNSTTLTPGTSGTFVANADGATLDYFSGATVTPLAVGTSVSLTAPHQNYVCTSTCTVTPPPPIAGYEFCVMNDDATNTVITLTALGLSARYENTARSAYGTATTGTLVSGGATGDKVCILGRDSTHYLTTSFTGTWTAS